MLIFRVLEHKKNSSNITKAKVTKPRNFRQERQKKIHGRAIDKLYGVGLSFVKN